jgi:hypothetical protein
MNKNKKYILFQKGIYKRKLFAIMFFEIYIIYNKKEEFFDENRKKQPRSLFPLGQF